MVVLVNIQIGVPPRIVTRPESGVSEPPMIDMSVDLPSPLRPYDANAVAGMNSDGQVVQHDPLRYCGKR